MSNAYSFFVHIVGHNCADQTPAKSKKTQSLLMRLIRSYKRLAEPDDIIYRGKKSKLKYTFSSGNVVFFQIFLCYFFGVNDKEK